MLIDSCDLKEGGSHGRWWRYRECPFCGNTKWKFYLYIDLNNESAVGYHCKRCDQKSRLIDDTVLAFMGITGVEIPHFKGVNQARRHGELFTDVELLPDDADISKIQNYVYSRIGVVPTFEELKMFQYVADPIKYLQMVTMEDFNHNKFIDRFCFKLSNGGLTCRYKNDTQTRWIKHSVVQNAGPGIYVVHNEFDNTKPIHACIAEGVFDILGLYYHGGFNNALYIGAQGTNYGAGIEHLIDKGIFGNSVTVGIYKDGNVNNCDIRYNRKFKKLFKSITIYENIIESDYGHTKDKIEIHKSLVKE